MVFFKMEFESILRLTKLPFTGGSGTTMYVERRCQWKSSGSKPRTTQSILFIAKSQ